MARLHPLVVGAAGLGLLETYPMTVEVSAAMVEVVVVVRLIRSGLAMAQQDKVLMEGMALAKALHFHLEAAAALER